MSMLSLQGVRTRALVWVLIIMNFRLRKRLSLDLKVKKIFGQDCSCCPGLLHMFKISVTLIGRAEVPVISLEWKQWFF